MTAAIAQLAAAGDGDRRRRRRLRRHVPIPRAGARRAGARDGPVCRPGRRPGRVVGGAHRPDAPGLVRDADQPAAEGDRHRAPSAAVRDRGAQAGGRPGRWSSSTTRSRRRLSSGRWSWARTSSSTRRPSTSAGHSDTVVGVAVTSDDEMAERLRFLQNAMGGVPGPFDCFLVLRGLRTLRCGWSATRPTRWRWPGSSPTATTSRGMRTRAWTTGRTPIPGTRRPLARCASAARRRSGGWSRSCRRPAGRQRPHRAGAGRRDLASGCALFTLGESLGGVESLIEVPAAMTHLSVAESALAVDPALVRLSVGNRGRRGPHRRPGAGARPGVGRLQTRSLSQATSSVASRRDGSRRDSEPTLIRVHASRCVRTSARCSSRRGVPELINGRVLDVHVAAAT